MDANMKSRSIGAMLILLAAGLVFFRDSSDFTTPSVGSLTESANRSNIVRGSTRSDPAGAVRESSSEKHSGRATSDRIGEEQKLSQQLKIALTAPDALLEGSRASELLSRLLDLAPVCAARIAESMEPEDGRDQVLLRVAQGWGSRNITAALDWASGLSDDGERHDAFVEISLQAASRDSRAAVDIALEYDLDVESPSVLPLLCQIWAEDNIGEVLAWSQKRAERLPYGEIVARIAFVQSQTAPAEAACLVATHIQPGPVQDEAVMSVLHQWALRDPDEPRRWVEDFVDGPLKERALTELLGIRAPF